MALNRSPILRPFEPPPPPPPPVVKPVKPAAAPPVKPLPAVNARTADFNSSGQAAKTALFKKFETPAALPTGAPPTAPIPTALPPARGTAPTQFIGPVPPPPGNVPAAPGQLSLVESKGVSSVAYDAKHTGEVYRFADGSAWRVEQVQDNEGFFDTGFKAVAMRRVVPDGAGFKDDPTDNRVAVGFAGTGGLNDVDDDLDQGTGLMPEQYRQGLNFLNEVRGGDAARNCETVTATGHSLGGGIASYVSVQTGVPATAVNAAPLAKNNIPNDAGSYDNQITQYYAKGEVLTDLDNVNPLDARPGQHVEVSARFAETEGDGPFAAGANIVPSIKNHMMGNTAPEINDPVKIYG